MQLALSLLAQSPTNRVGLIDLDITGPSLPRMVGLDTPTATVHQSSAGWVPVYVDQGRRLAVMSIGFLLKDRGDSVVWRGPKKDGMIRQFLSEVRWGDLDYLIIDTPPGESPVSYPKNHGLTNGAGTSDEHISLVTHLHPLFTPTVSNPTTPTSILISTPQTTALNDTLKSLSFTRKLSLPVMGLVENMAGYVCPCCGEISDTFGKGGGEAMAHREGVGFLGRVPIDTVLVSLLDAVSKGEVLGEGAVEHSSDEATEGQTNSSTEHFPLLDKYLETASSKVWKDITQKLVDKIEQRKLDIHANLESSSRKPTTA